MTPPLVTGLGLVNEWMDEFNLVVCIPSPLFKSDIKIHLMENWFFPPYLREDTEKLGFKESNKTN